MEKQQIKARFFGMHIGVQVEVDGESFVLAGISSSNSAKAFEVMLHGSNRWPLIESCKLILRPLSSITDEEAIDALTRATGLYIVAIERHSDKIVGVSMGSGSGNIISGGGNVAMWLKTSPLPMGRFLETWSVIKGMDAPEYMDYIAFDYLRSLGFCLPFMGLDPVEEGWAVLSE
jgi:hypothetical protein